MAVVLNDNDTKEERVMSRLITAIDASFVHLRPFREHRIKFLKEYVGGHYGSLNRPLQNNLIYHYITVMKRALTPGNPRGRVDTFISALKPDADDLEQALNIRLEEMNLKSQLKEMLVEALCGFGVIKVGLNYSETVEIGGFEHDVMKPFAELVEFEDFVWDTSAKRWEMISFCGNRYKMDIDDAEESGLFDADAIKSMKRNLENPQEHGEEELAIEFTTGKTAVDEQFDQTVTLWDIWLPKKNQIITYIDETHTIVREVEWDGPEGGPYHTLGFDIVPGNIMPIPPVSQLYDIHVVNNKLLNKTSDQALAQKKITTVGHGSELDATNLINASDGDAIRMKNNAQIGETNMVV